MILVSVAGVLVLVAAGLFFKLGMDKKNYNDFDYQIRMADTAFSNHKYEESYKFVCNYKNLGEKNIISAVVHLDEGAPHLHLMFVPVVHTKDKDGKPIEKICTRDFWKGRDSYRKLQDAYFNHVKSKGFDLERGLYVEETNRKHMSLEKFKQVTNYAKTKEILKSVYDALKEKGYNPINQIVGYILSGDPTYITSHNNARNLIREVERDELLEKMVKYYIGLDE